MTYSERELSARIVQREVGGEGDDGMKAVALYPMTNQEFTDMKKSDKIEQI